MSAVVLIVRTWEKTRPFAIVEHWFRGVSRAEAHAYYEAHRKADAFLLACTTTGVYQGRVKCHSTFEWRIEP